MRAPDGAAVLTFFEGPHQNVFDGDKDFDRHRLSNALLRRTILGRQRRPQGRRCRVENSCCASTNRPVSARGSLTMGARRRRDHRTLETHPHVEELFLLDGEISMPQGLLKRGAYFWRPGGIQHGPIGTRAGCTCFFRCKEGPFSTDWTSHTETIVWDAPYQTYAARRARRHRRTRPIRARPY